MEKNKIVEANEKIAQGVTAGFQKIQDAVTGTYDRIEDGVVGAYEKVETAFVERYLAKDGETLEEAKARLKGQDTRKETEAEA